MQKRLVSFVAICALTATAAWAQEDTRSYRGGRTRGEVSEVTRGVYDSPLHLSPRAGLVGFADGTGSYTSRVMEGLNMDINLMPFIRNMNLGVGTGLLYTHVGPNGSNFWGTGSPTGFEAGANTFMFPIHAFANGRIAERMFAGAQVGTTAVYRSISRSMSLGRAADTSPASSTEFFPSLGLNVGWEVSRNVALALRGDYIITAGPDMFTTTLGATIPLA